MIKRSAVQPKVIIKTISEAQNIVTLAVRIQTQEVLVLQDLWLPKFDKNQCTSQQKRLLFENVKVKYDNIMGTNLLLQAGIKLN